MTTEHLPAPPATNQSESKHVVRWTYPDGRKGEGSALPKSVAEAMCALYASRYTDRTYSIVPAE